MPSGGVRASVCSSVTFVYYVETAKRFIDFFLLLLVPPFEFFYTKRYGNIPKLIPNGIVQCNASEA